jgi:transposase
LAYRTLADAQKKAERGGWTIVWVDEAAFYLLASVVRTYAPQGQPPLLEVSLTRDHLAMISGITAPGRLVQRTQDHPFTGADIARFVRQVRRAVPGRVLLLWDGAAIHRSREVQEYLASAAGQGVWIEVLPVYAPELNPDEGVWQHLKQVELGNVCCRDQRQLRQELRWAVGRLRRKPQVIQSFVQQRGY